MNFPRCPFSHKSLPELTYFNHIVAQSHGYGDVVSVQGHQQIILRIQHAADGKDPGWRRFRRVIQTIRPPTSGDCWWDVSNKHSRNAGKSQDTRQRARILAEEQSSYLGEREKKITL